MTNEVRTLHALNGHPHIQTFFDWYEATTSLWLILDYCPGGNLRSILEEDGPFPYSTVITFALDLLSALQVFVVFFLLL